VLVLYRTPRAFPETFDESCAGVILEEPRGSEGFGYDPLFFSEELGKSFGEATPEEKDAVSHRAKAFQALRRALEGPSLRAAETPSRPAETPSPATEPQEP
jgi:XTP/dITP diphosphohydrolase